MRTHVRSSALAALSACALLTVAACSDDPSGSPSERPPTSENSLRLVVLGDSIARADTCPDCARYPEQLAAAMADELKAAVEVENLAWAATNPTAAEVADILDLVRTDPSVGESVAAADAVVVTVGQNDLAYNRLDDPCGVGAEYPRIEWEGVTHSCVDAATAEYESDLDALLTEIESLRAGKPTMLRVTTVYNSAIGDLVDPTWNSPAAVEPTTYAVEQMVGVQCDVAREHGGACADAFHLLNGKSGAESAQPFLNPADATHLAQRGQDAFAEALIAEGMAPLQ